MFESHAIMKFMVTSRQLPEHWYPTAMTDVAIRKRAEMDMYLDWHHAGIRLGASGYFFRKYLSGFMNKDGKWASEDTIQESAK